MSDRSFRFAAVDHPSSKHIPDHENGARVIERPVTGRSDRFDNARRANPKAKPTVGASERPEAGDVPVAAGASRPADAGAARAPGDTGMGPALPAATAPAGADYVIDDLLDDEPNSSPLPADMVKVFGMTPSEVRELLKDAKGLVERDDAGRRARLHTTPSPKTVQLYRDKMQIMAERFSVRTEFAAHPAMELLAPYAQSSQTYKVMRAALKWHLMRRVKFRVAELDTAVAEDKPMPARSYLSLQSAIQVANGLERLSRQDCLAFTLQKPRPARSTRSMLTALSNDQRKRFLVEAERSPRYRNADVVLNFCGLRPEELCKGVKLEWKNSGSILVTIQGAKVREGVAGQAWRSMRLNAAALPSWFVEQVQTEQVMRVTAEPDAMRAHLSRLAPEVLAPRRGGKAPRLSAYVFRHALVTDLRDEGWETEEIAAVIGERSAATVAWYGRRRRGKGKVRPHVAIERGSVLTASPVKPLDRSGLKAVLDAVARPSSKRRPK